MFIDIVFQSEGVINQGSIKGFWDYFIPLLAAGASLGTLWIAYKIFKNRDAKKIFTQHQIETVLDLANSLENTFFTFTYYRTRTNHSLYSTYVRGLKLKDLKEEVKGIESSKVYFYHYLYYCEFISFHNDLFLPEIIKKEIMNFFDGEQLNISNDDLEKMNNYLTLAVDQRKSFKKDLTAYEMLNENAGVIDSKCPIFKNPESFLKQVLQLKKVIIKWMKEYGIEPNISAIE